MFEKFFKPKENPSLRIAKDLEEAARKEKLEVEEGKKLPAEEEKKLLVKATAEEGVASALYKFEKLRQKKGEKDILEEKSAEAEDKL